MRPRIRVCNVFVVSKSNLTGKAHFKVSIKSHSICVSWTANESEIDQTFVLPDMRLIPKSLSGLQVRGNSLSFRVQTEPLTNTSGSFAAEIIPLLRNLSFEQNASIYVPGIVPNVAHTLLCRCCGNKLSLTDITVKRVLPLPTDSTSQFEWFCHNHGGSGSDDVCDVAASDVKKTDCLYGMYFVLLSTAWLQMEASEVLSCARCFSWLGTCKGSTAKLWRCTTTWGDDNAPQMALGDFLAVIGEAVRGTMGMLCKIVLETKLSPIETQYILLWVIDKELQVLAYVNDADQIPQLSGGLETETVLAPKKTMKVLYSHHVSRDDEVKSWQNDVNVQGVDIAKQMFVEGLQYLAKVTNYLPAAHRMSGGFYVCHLGL
ncbi:uncharacterized protein LOC134538675 [Bacillus rossius redtenbacheri]|uniref:uncharacterized protein LOC134538675 n=1 Tax=Bacillus rossius redtenbacheri TaxID=93214 RepID=UPI002FDCB89F